VLSDAQLVIARGHGFTGWPHMKRKIESLTKSPAELFKGAVEAGDVDHVRQLLQSHPDLVSKINEPMFGFKSRPCMSPEPIPSCSISCLPWRRSQRSDQLASAPNLCQVHSCKPI
jgi:hypothetical protein